MAVEIVLTPEERLAQLSDTLIAGIVGKDEVSLANRGYLYSAITPEFFLEENHIIYKVFYNFREKLITPDEAFIKLYLLRNESVVLDSTDKISINAYSELDENPVVGYTAGVIKQFIRLCGETPLQPAEYNLEVEKYKLEYLAFKAGQVYSEAKIALYDGIKYGRKSMQGFDGSRLYVKQELAKLEGMTDDMAGEGFLDASVVGMRDDTKKKPKRIGDFGMLEELNKHFGGIYTGNFYSIVAPTKGGKSKFTSRLVHDMVVKGVNAVVWAVEGGYTKWLYQLRAIHFDTMYNKDELDTTKHITGVSQEMISKDDFPTPEIKELEQASRTDIFTNPNYGKIMTIDRACKVETFIEELTTAIDTVNAEVVLIDYLQLIEWDTRGMSKSQAIGLAYQKALRLCREKNVALIVPAQFTQDFMNEMAKSKDGSSHEVRTAGGESSEVVRTPDIILGLYASPEDLMANSMKILSVPSRVASPFPTFEIYADLCSCIFASLPD